MESEMYEVQGRVIERIGDVIVRDEVRLSTSDTHAAATRTAKAFVADGFTIWIFVVHRGLGSSATYRLVDMQSPVRPGPVWSLLPAARAECDRPATPPR